MNVTPKEMAVLMAIRFNDFGNGDNLDGSEVWADCINDSRFPSGVEGKSLSSIIASLNKKGLVVSNGHKGRDACVSLTEAAAAVFNVAEPVVEPTVEAVVEVAEPVVATTTKQPTKRSVVFGVMDESLPMMEVVNLMVAAFDAAGYPTEANVKGCISWYRWALKRLGGKVEAAATVRKEARGSITAKQAADTIEARRAANLEKLKGLVAFHGQQIAG